MNRNTLTLYELNEFIRRIIALNFQEKIWVEAEIAGLKNSRGHLYLDLVQKDTSQDLVVAHSQAVVWETTFRKLAREGLAEVLQEALKVRLLVQPDFHERFGLKLIVENVDPSYTFGELAVQKRHTLERLKAEGLLELNKSLPLPPVLQRIAVLSSSQAAGYQDFIQQLQGNPFRFSFRHQLFEMAVQGKSLEDEGGGQLKKIKPFVDRFDCAVVIRGGGSRVDLSGFDTYSFCKELAHLGLPVFTGIGHDIDESVADKIAHTSLKTPTAVADFIIHHNVLFESAMGQLAQNIGRHCRRILQEEEMDFRRTSANIYNLTNRILFLEKEKTSNQNGLLQKALQLQLLWKKKDLHTLELLTHSLHPQEAFKRGFSITTKEGMIVKSVDEVLEGDFLATHWADGTVEYRVKTKNQIKK